MKRLRILILMGIVTAALEGFFVLLKFLFIKNVFIYLFILHEHFDCMYVCVPYMCLMLLEARSGCLTSLPHCVFKFCSSIVKIQLLY